MNEFYEMLDGSFIQWIEEIWDIRIQGVRGDLDIQGSPERTLSRVAVEDHQGRIFILEKFALGKLENRQRIAVALERLNGRGLSQALGGMVGKKDRILNVYKDGAYQITPFIPGSTLARPHWLDSPEIGKSLADFLIQMKSIPDSLTMDLGFDHFDIKPYIQGLFKGMENHDPKRARQYLPFWEFLNSGFMDRRKGLRFTFCHGDFHPLNIIWDNHRLQAVIDWEFAGFKPDIYDAANLVGCAGIEHPQGLVGPMVITFLHEIRKSGIICPGSWGWFLEYVLALRFAWLSEWLRKEDTQMLETEAAFMEILIRHRADLREAWEI